MVLAGGKYYLAKPINAIIATQPHTHFVEAFAGGLSVLLQWDGPGRSELVNDLNGDLVNFWRVLRDDDTFDRFRRQVEAIPMAREEWDQAADYIATRDIAGRPDVEHAVAFFIWCRQSFAGAMKGFTIPTRTRLRREMNGNVSEWIGAVDGLPEIHKRLRGVFIENMPALDLIRREDTPGTLFYLDPPYVHSTRETTDFYAHEMTEADHEELLDTIKSLKGKVMISGYACDLYDSALAAWTMHAFDLPNNAAGGREKRRMIERLWCNF